MGARIGEIVDAKRIGLEGVSLGGYYCPRAVAFEPRFAMGVVWGGATVEEFMRIAENVHLDGIPDRIQVPFLVTHGEKDSQIPLQWAQRTCEQLVNSPKRELKIAREGGVQHSSFDNSANAGVYIADWVAETLGGHTAAPTARCSISPPAFASWARVWANRSSRCRCVCRAARSFDGHARL
jgi:dienelactone hydrolase